MPETANLTLVFAFYAPINCLLNRAQTIEAPLVVFFLMPHVVSAFFLLRAIHLFIPSSLFSLSPFILLLYLPNLFIFPL